MKERTKMKRFRKVVTWKNQEAVIVPLSLIGVSFLGRFSNIFRVLCIVMLVVVLTTIKRDVYYKEIK